MDFCFPLNLLTTRFTMAQVSSVKLRSVRPGLTSTRLDKKNLDELVNFCDVTPFTTKRLRKGISAFG